jgi:ribose 5-phosphate isomerase B
MSFDLSKPIAIGCDHAGFEYKIEIVKFLNSKGWQVKDFGTYAPDSVDYPDYAHPVSEAVEKQEVAFGILLCGSANGVAITANKHPAVRAGLCWISDVAKLVRLHNNANIICIPARFVSVFQAKELVDIFINTEFEGGRHANRVDKISCS